MPISFNPSRPKTPPGPTPPEEAVEAFGEFFESHSLPEATDAFMRVCKHLDIESHGLITEFYPRFKVLVFSFIVKLRSTNLNILLRTT